MKFEFEISDYDFEDFYGTSNFKYLVVKEAASQIVNKIYNDLDYETREIIKDIIKEHRVDIISKTIALTEEKLSDAIAKKRTIVEITPKASELATINKENEKYFMELIDKAIAKRFK